MSSPITLYTTNWCPDCWRVKTFLKERGIPYREVNIERDADAQAIVMQANNGKRSVPTLEFEGRHFSCSPFNATRLANELRVPLNPKS